MQTLTRLFASLLLCVSLAACGAGEQQTVSQEDMGPLEALRYPALVGRYDQAFWNDLRTEDEALLRAGARYCQDSVWAKDDLQPLHPNCRAVAAPINALNSREARDTTAYESFSADSFTFN